jgi:hypothetical protein
MRVVPLLIALLASTPALAGKKAGVTMPDQITMGGKNLTLNGMGLREATFLKIDVYVAGLYLEHVSSTPATILAANEVKVLTLRFVRDVGHGDIVDAWNSGFKHNATVPLAQIKPAIDQLNKWMPSFDDGDTLTFVYIPGSGVTVAVNGVRKGTIAGEDFARSLFAIWLGPKPPSGDLKRGLLGKHPGVP